MQGENDRLPFHVVCRPVMHIASFPVGVISGIKTTPFGVELVGEDQFHFGAIVPACLNVI